MAHIFLASPRVSTERNGPDSSPKESRPIDSQIRSAIFRLSLRQALEHVSKVHVNGKGVHLVLRSPQNHSEFLHPPGIPDLHRIFHRLPDLSLDIRTHERSLLAAARTQCTVAFVRHSWCILPWSRRSGRLPRTP